METLTSVLTNTYFKNICVPLVALVITVLFKAISKRDGFKVERNDYAVGFDLLVSALLLFVTGMIDLASRSIKAVEAAKVRLISGSGQSESIQAFTSYQQEAEKINYQFIAATLIVFFLVLILAFIPSFIRHKGWNSSGELKWFQGIIIPSLLGLAFFTVVVLWIGT